MSAGPEGSVILSLYEKGMAASPARRAALLCAAAGADPEALPMGDVDRRIWGFLNAMFSGPHEAVSACSDCGEAVEFVMPPDFAPPPRVGGDEVEVSYRGTSHKVRMPRLADVRDGRARLENLAPDAPWDDPGFVAAAEEALEAADPGLRLLVVLQCAACGSEQSKVFDAAGYTWQRVELAARQLLREIVSLARSLGWSEADLLGMSAARRAIYLAELGE